MKIGRNDKCFCGSGLKYKKCHLGRDKLKRSEPWQVNKLLLDSYSSKFCSAPESVTKDCSSQIIKAHTIPKSTSLKKLAKNNHVYGLISHNGFIQRDKGLPVLQQMGLNRASTFTGFCKKHDNELFSPIEKIDFNNTPEQCFLLAYRAFCREYFVKLAANNLNESSKNLDKGMPQNEQMAYQLRHLYKQMGTKAALEDNNYHKTLFDQILLTKDYSAVRAVIFELDDVPPIMCSGGTNPDFDFDGNDLQDFGNFEVRLDLLTVTSFFDGNCGKIIFAWIQDENGSNSALIESLLNKSDNLSIYLFQFILSHFENIYISPFWWDGLLKRQQKEVLKLMKSGVGEVGANCITTPILTTDLPDVVNILRVGN